MPKDDESSDEFVDEESGEDEGSSASFESEEDEDVEIDEDDDGHDEVVPKKPPARSPSKPATQSTAAGKRKSPPNPPAAGKPSRAKKAPRPSPTKPRGAPPETHGKRSPPMAPGGGKGKGRAEPDPGVATAATAASAPSSSSSSSQASSSAPQEDIPATPATPTPPTPLSSSAETPASGKTASVGGGTRKAGVVGGGTSTPSSGKATGAGSSTAKTPKAIVLDYMLRTNRPYSCINVHDNLHKKLPKPVVQKILDELVGGGALRVQEYGKAKIYYPNQDALPNGAGDVSDAKLQALDQEAKDLTKEAEVASAQAREAVARVQSLSSQPTDAALEEALAEAEGEVKRLEERNSSLKGQGRTEVTGGMKKAKADFNRYRAMWVTRKRNAMDVVDMIADGMEKKPSQIMEMLGLEPDEASIPPKM